ncbi:MAG: hypothetical protein KGL96_08755 [Hyphomicrobiales bacterium]|nr:hypothetical protein [Hyphomicrobiales bacterium]
MAETTTTDERLSGREIVSFIQREKSALFASNKNMRAIIAPDVARTRR